LKNTRQIRRHGLLGLSTIALWAEAEGHAKHGQRYYGQKATWPLDPTPHLMKSGHLMRSHGQRCRTLDQGGGRDLPRFMGQSPRRFSTEVQLKVKEEIERLLEAGFIRTAWYVEWLANIVPVLKNTGALRICTDYRNLNLATPKDEYPMPMFDPLVDGAVKHELLSFMDGHAGYNQIFIAEEDVHKTAFRCPSAIGTYE
ncbi:unnamed protein product, partial [Prunus brigantina]